jgi:hypothetical protein
MGQYKVPQDVEAEDKLIGWLSFRQLIYAGIGIGASAMCFFFFQIFPPLALVPLPVAILFIILTLPLRKDQPMETYLIAVVRFYLKSKIRRWDPDGVPSYVEIVTPLQEERRLSKDFTPDTAQERLDYLARIMDSRGWAYKQIDGVPYGQNLSSDVAAEATTAVDVMDEHSSLSQSFANLAKRKDEERIQRAKAVMQKAQQEVTIPAGPPPKISNVRSEDGTIMHPTFNPYPTSMHQKVILPENEKPKTAPKKPAAPMTPKVSPGIMRLATNSDGLSVAAIANEAKRLEDKEVVIKLH